LKNARQTGLNTTETCAKMAAEKPPAAEFKQSQFAKANFASG